tara:strand:- start:12 stop:524 length:513 start_codon:yes stop_codon:yes gene_type:complete
MIIWITGLPGSGKTTLAKKIKSILEKKIVKNIVLLDGDTLRGILPNKLSYSNEDRVKLSIFYSKLALLIEESNCIVICSFVALFHSVQAYIRLNAKDYFEIFLDPSFDQLSKKNKKDLYSEKSEYLKNQIKDYEFPINPDLRINTIVHGVYQDKSEEISEKIMNKLTTYE